MEGGAKIVGVFRVKNHDFTPKKSYFFSNFRGARAGCAPPLNPPLQLQWSSAVLVVSVLLKSLDILTTSVTWRMLLLEQELLTQPKHLSLPPAFSEARVARSIVFYVVFCKQLFIFLSFFVWPLHCLSFFNLRLLVTSLVSLSFSLTTYIMYMRKLTFCEIKPKTKSIYLYYLYKIVIITYLL